MKLWKDWYTVRARRVDNNEWKSIDFYGTLIHLFDKKFTEDFIITEKDGSYYLGEVEVKPDTLEYSDGEFKRLDTREGLIKEYNQRIKGVYYDK